MDIEQYLAEQKRRIGRESRNVRDFSVFDFNYVPPTPVSRDETTELIDAMLQFEATGVPIHMAIIGSRGSGKTLTLRYLQRLVGQSTQLTIRYANCRQYNTTYKLLRHLLGRPAAGASTQQLYEQLTAEAKGKTVVVLDEIDLMSPKDKRREILYLLSRSEHPFMAVMLSNSPQILRQLDAATRSSLQPVPLHFRNYNAEQIRRILLDRARAGLHRWEAGTLAQIAALTTRLTNADARVAIKTLFYSVTRPGGDLEACFERARRDIVVDLVNDLAESTLLIVQAVAVSDSPLAKDIYRRYCRLAQQRSEKPFSYVHFYANLSYLQSMGLIALASTKVGRTYTNRILLTFDTAVVTSLCRLRFG
ncbi:MAG: Cdc6/Cdc18 family protein [Planctomycetota bacterium]